MKTKIIFLLFALVCLVPGQSKADVRLPKIFSNNMILQREQPARFWGWASKNEKVKVELAGKTIISKAKNDGTWQVEFPAFQAGGPYTISISGEKNKIVLENVLFGDIWVCSGQSNMEFMLKQAKNSESEISNANYDKIRLLKISRASANLPKTDLTDEQWKVCSSTTTPDFSAVSYFFGRDVFQSINVPIGLISTSWGGSKIESWMDIESLEVLPQNMQHIQEIKKDPAYTYHKKDSLQKVQNEWYDRFYKSSAYINEKGVLNRNTKFFDASDWHHVKMKNYLEDAGMDVHYGITWYKKSLDMPESFLGKDLEINLGWISEVSVIFFNNQKIGGRDYRGSECRFTIPSSLVKQSANEIIVCALNESGKTGFWGPVPLSLSVLNSSVNISLEDSWLVKQLDNTDDGKKSGRPAGTVFESQDFSFLYNGMISPLTKLPVKGFIWYQGESNSSQPEEYRVLLSTMIQSWRTKWGIKEAPFFIVQLANYGIPEVQPVLSDWARLMEVQNIVPKEVANTGTITINDIGDANNIHPNNKQVVGYRLSLLARRFTYNELKLVYSGPTFKSMKIEGQHIIISFNNIGGGLVCNNKYNYLNNFAIAGSDNVFHWAKAFIQGDNVIVYSDEVSNPVNVRYAIDKSPVDVNFYNRAGLPAVMFRTDNFELQ